MERGQSSCTSSPRANKSTVQPRSQQLPASSSTASGGAARLVSRRPPAAARLPGTSAAGQRSPRSRRWTGRSSSSGTASSLDAMQVRLQPAESRVDRFSAKIAARYIAFDVVSGRERRRERPAVEATRELERTRQAVQALPCPATIARRHRLARALQDDRSRRRDPGAPRASDLPGSREEIIKVRPEKTTDCVIVGVRWKEKPDRLATLFLSSKKKRARSTRSGFRSHRSHAAQRRRGRRPTADPRERAGAPLLRADRSHSGKLEELTVARSSSSRVARTRCR